MRIDSILTILDKPKHEQVALERALTLAERTRAPLTLAAFCYQPLASGGAEFTLAEQDALRDRLVAERRQWQRELAAAPRAKRLDIRLSTVWTDDIAGWVARATESAENTLLVKSVHKSRTLLHTPLDWRLLREVRVPILLAQQRKRRTMRNILAALDLRTVDRTHQRLNRKVLDAAMTFGRLFDAQVHCFYAVEVSQVLRDLDVVDTRRAQEKARRAARGALEELLEPHGLSARDVHFPVGKLGQAAAAIGRQVRADLLVVGTAARRVRQKLGLGNSAERLVTKATCDVLAVHP
jgi:universal stress protein E